MIKEILDGITAALHAAYETYDIYADQNIEQGLTEPCFFIESVDAPSTDVVKGWNERTYSFDVMFFPEDETDRATMYNVGDALHLILRRITVDDDGESRTVSAADGATYRIVDGVLHYTVAYDLHLVYEYGGDVKSTPELDNRFSSEGFLGWPIYATRRTGIMCVMAEGETLTRAELDKRLTDFYSKEAI